MDKKYKCRDCKYLDMNDKSTIGYKCVNPNITHARMGDRKYASSPACKKGFEEKE